jgi:hypothetical protein
MKDTIISEKLRDYYAGQELSNDAIRRIHENAKLTRPSLFSFRPILGLATAAVALVSVAVFYLGLTPGLDDRIDSEVRKNYAKDLDPEVKANDFDTLATGLSRLGFALAPTTSSSRLEGWKVEGGRYCSLDGEFAAQVNLTDEAGRKSLLYVVSLSENLDRTDVGERTYDDATLRLWKDDGRLFVQAIPNG